MLLVGLISLGPGTLLDLLSGLVYMRGGPATVRSATPYPDAELAQRLTSAAVLSRGHLSVAVVDLSSGASASLDGDRPGQAASLFKVPILLQVLADADAGRLSEDSLLEVRQDDWSDGSGVLQARVGDRLTVRELEALMIADSDNIAALMLLNAVGATRVNATVEALGLRSTRVANHRAGETDDHTTSAADMTRLMQLLASGQAVSPRVSQRAMDQLEAHQQVQWLSNGLPFWIRLAHKWGDLPSARNDSGVIFSPRASYAITVLTDGAVPDEAAAAIGRLSHAAYAYLSTGR